MFDIVQEGRVGHDVEVAADIDVRLGRAIVLHDDLRGDLAGVAFEQRPDGGERLGRHLVLLERDSDLLRQTKRDVFDGHVVDERQGGLVGPARTDLDGEVEDGVLGEIGARSVAAVEQRLVGAREDGDFERGVGVLDLEGDPAPVPTA